MPSLPRVAGSILALMVLAYPLNNPLIGQATTVTLQGAVGAQGGGALPGAQVEPSGRYHVLGLPAGIYDLTVRAIGYREQRREAVQLILGQHSIQNFVLETGTVELAPLVVTAERPFEIERTDVSTAVLQEEIE